MFLGDDAIAAHPIRQHFLEDLEHQLFFNQLVGLVALDDGAQLGFQKTREAFDGHALFFGGEEIHGVGLGVLSVSFSARSCVRRHQCTDRWR